MYPIFAAIVLVGGTVFACKRLFKRKTPTKPIVVVINDSLIAIYTTTQADLYVLSSEKNLKLDRVAELPIPSGFEFEVVDGSIHIKSAKEIRIYNQTGDLVEIKYM